MIIINKIINMYILLISIFVIISSNKKRTSLEYCNVSKYCSDCIFCGNKTKEYTQCSYYNLFCTKEHTGEIFYEESNIKTYSEFFRNIPNADKFCGQATYTLDSLIDSISIIKKSNKDMKKSNINHCNYEIYNSKYFYNYEGLASLIIKFKVNNSKKNNLKFTFNILLWDSHSGSSKQIVMSEADLIKERYELLLYNYNKIIILLDIYVDGETNLNTDGSLEIKIDTDNASSKKRKLIATSFISVFSILIITIISIIIAIYCRRKHSRMTQTQNEFSQKEELKKGKNEDKIKRLFETIFIAKEFNESDITNDCTECTICIEKFVDKCLICITPCKHIFHYECLSKYVEAAKGKQKLVIKCPLCNYDFLEEKNVKEKLNEVNNINNANDERSNNIINKNEKDVQQSGSTIRPRAVDGNCMRRSINSKEDLRNNNNVETS